MTQFSSRWARALCVVLVAYPRAFRRRFGDEVRADFLREIAGATATRVVRILATHVRHGLAERAAAAVRWAWWPNHEAHLYEPTGRHAMFWDNLRSDIRFTLRQATRAPGFTSLAVAALALGIGANSAVFSVVNGVLLRPLPYHEPERLVMVWSDNQNEGRSLNVVSPANFTDFRARSRTFSGLDYSASFLMRLTVRGEEDAPPVWTLRTGASLFEVLGRQAALGRTYRAGERGVAVVSHNYWVTRLGARPRSDWTLAHLVRERGGDDHRRDAAGLRVPVSLDVRPVGVWRCDDRRPVDSHAARGPSLGDRRWEPRAQRALARHDRPAGAGRIAGAGARRPAWHRRPAGGRIPRLESRVGHDGRVAHGPDGRRRAAGAVDRPRGSGPDSAHGRRERGQPGARPQRRAAARARGTCGAGSVAIPTGVASAHRKRHPLAGRSGVRSRLGRLGCARAGRAGTD